MYVFSMEHGLRGTLTATFSAGREREELGHQVGGTDLDGDGYMDAWLGAPGSSDMEGRLYLLAGGAPLLDRSVEDLPRIEGTPNDGLGEGGVTAGDLDGDGRLDLFVGAPYRNGRIYAFRSPAVGSATVEDAAWYLYGGSVDWGGGEGLGEALAWDGALVGGMCCWSYQTGQVFHVRDMEAPEREEYYRSPDLAQFGEPVMAVDLTGDGMSEIVAGELWGYGEDLAVTGAAVIFDGATGAQRRVYGLEDNESHGEALAGADLDNDGRAELIVGAPEWDEGPGAVYIWDSEVAGP